NLEKIRAKARIFPNSKNCTSVRCKFQLPNHPAKRRTFRTLFTPCSTNEDSPAEVVFLGHFEGVAASTPESYFRDATWAYDRLAVADVEPSDAPSPGAWSLLNWAKQNQDRFFEQIMPKVLAAKQRAITSSGSEESDSCDDTTVLEELLAGVLRNVEEGIKGNMPAHVRQRVRYCLDELNKRWNVTVPSEYPERLAARMVKLIDEVVQVAIKDPEPFRATSE
ncbi:hypothetical protein, partial [Bythopirellula polymerisocia]|uniref:hypothetical protein n=1 Tax=Bythopirellula polymerisocia TaxID=2528003 RepID=UPI001E61A679